MNFYVMVYNYGGDEGYSMPMYVWRAEELRFGDVRKGLLVVDHRLVCDLNINELIRDRRLYYLEIHEFAEV